MGTASGDALPPASSGRGADRVHGSRSRHGGSDDDRHHPPHSRHYGSPFPPCPPALDPEVASDPDSEDDYDDDLPYVDCPSSPYHGLPSASSPARFPHYLRGDLKFELVHESLGSRRVLGWWWLNTAFMSVEGAGGAGHCYSDIDYTVWKAMEGLHGQQREASVSRQSGSNSAASVPVPAPPTSADSVAVAAPAGPLSQIPEHEEVPAQPTHPSVNDSIPKTSAVSDEEVLLDFIDSAHSAEAARDQDAASRRAEAHRAQLEQSQRDGVLDLLFQHDAHAQAPASASASASSSGSMLPVLPTTGPSPSGVVPPRPLTVAVSTPLATPVATPVATPGATSASGSGGAANQAAIQTQTHALAQSRSIDEFDALSPVDYAFSHDTASNADKARRVASAYISPASTSVSPHANNPPHSALSSPMFCSPLAQPPAAAGAAGGTELSELAVAWAWWVQTHSRARVFDPKEATKLICTHLKQNGTSPDTVSVEHPSPRHSALPTQSHLAPAPSPRIDFSSATAPPAPLSLPLLPSLPPAPRSQIHQVTLHVEDIDDAHARGAHPEMTVVVSFAVDAGRVCDALVEGMDRFPEVRERYADWERKARAAMRE